MLERFGMLFVVCGAFGMTDLAGVRPASGFCMLARILCHIHVSDVVHVFVFVSVSKIEDQHARRVVVQQHSFRTSGSMGCWLLGEQIATSPWPSGSSLCTAGLPARCVCLHFLGARQ